ncbi:ap-3 complex subunit mu-1 [Echinococcus multilocularis]|uniref:Ap-3 complex subunit mu-1 n=1 Tax=Echinococcus multilocularis TaxID=6211 RepID=A0A0S4MIS0_ECHMU|nr:ap-3 complex subunit mu-1 [Echinococcus multilocularis]
MEHAVLYPPLYQLDRTQGEMAEQHRSENEVARRNRPVFLRLSMDMYDGLHIPPPPVQFANRKKPQAQLT